MKLAQDSPSAAEMQPLPQESQDNHQNNGGNEPHIADSNSISSANIENRKVSHEDIELVQNLIERCLQLYMNKGEVVRTLSNRARIEPSFTTLVWQKLEEENSEFFRAYYIRLKLKKQILMFNQLLEHQYHMMKYPLPVKGPLTPMQNGIHPMPVNNLPMGYPVIQQAQMPTSAQPHLDSIVNGIPAPAGFQPIRMSSANETFAAAPAGDMTVSPASAASSNHFPFTPTEMSAMDPTFTSNVETAGGLQDDGVGLSRDSIRSLGHLWNFSLFDLTADLTNLGDLGPLGDYTGSPFLPSESDILLDSPEQDDIVEDYFADTVNNGPCSQSDEEKS